MSNSEITFADRFGECEMEFGPAKFRVRSLNGRDSEYLKAQQASWPEGTAGVQGDILLVQIGCVGWDVRWSPAAGESEGEALPFDQVMVSTGAGSVQLVKRYLIEQLPQAVISALALKISRLSTLNVAELTELGFISPRRLEASSADARPAGLPAAPPATGAPSTSGTPAAGSSG